MRRQGADGGPGISLGRHVIASGEEAIVTSIGIDGRLHGHVPRRLTSTWWHPNGRHDLFWNFDLVHPESDAPSRQLNGAWAPRRSSGAGS